MAIKSGAFDADGIWLSWFAEWAKDLNLFLTRRISVQHGTERTNRPKPNLEGMAILYKYSFQVTELRTSILTRVPIISMHATVSTLC